MPEQTRSRKEIKPCLCIKGIVSPFKRAAAFLMEYNDGQVFRQQNVEDLRKVGKL